MKIKKLHNWFSLPELGFWTWTMWWFRHHDKRNDDEKDIAAIRYAIDNGITHIDAAELYACGYAEWLIKRALEWYDRDSLQIASKVKGSNCSYEAIKTACRKSLERLGIDYMDLYYIHWREEQFDLKDCIRAMDELVEEWLIKNIGVSNFSTQSLKEAQKYAKNKIVANQVHYNLIYRECCIAQWEEESLLEYCQNNDVMLVAWRPVELWKLANYAGVGAVEISERRDVTHAQVAINFLTSQKNVVAIFKSTNTQHIDENLWWIWWNMSEDELQLLIDDTSKAVYTSDAVPLW